MTVATKTRPAPTPRYVADPEKVDAKLVKKVAKDIAPFTSGVTVNQWAIGDYLNTLFPVIPGRGGDHSATEGISETLKAVAKQVDVSYQTLRHYRHMAAHYPASKRVKGRSYTSHRHVWSLSNRYEMLKDKTLSADDLKYIARGEASESGMPRLTKATAFDTYSILTDTSLSLQARVDKASGILVKYVLPAAPVGMAG